jgi:SAM-dependent methyltransferase
MTDPARPPTQPGPLQAQPEPYFDAFPELFDAYTAIHDADGGFAAWLLARLPSTGERAVDLGCGAGRHTVLLADRYQYVLGVDISAGMLDLAEAKRHRRNVTYQQRSLLDVTLGTDGRFDVVLSVATIHHLHDHDRALPRIKSLVAPGGTALLVDIVAPGPGWASRSWHRRYAAREALTVLRAHRSLAAARTAWRLRTHPRWLDHVTTNIPLTRAEFERRYAEVFHGATFETPHPLMCSARWSAPAS